MSMPVVLGHVPEKPTYVIRIFVTPSAKYPDLTAGLRLKKSPLYKRVVEYIFDDNDNYPATFELGPTWFSEQIAESIIRDFVNGKEDIEALLVHCTAGRNRSPAVAMALNEIFALGHDTDVLKQKYNRYNHFVYETLMGVGRTLPERGIRI